MAERESYLTEDSREKLNPPRVVRTDTVFSGRVFQVDSHTLQFNDGRESRFDQVSHSGAVVVLPQHHNGKLVLVRQYRPALGIDLYEFPAGTLEKGEDALFCAQRELAEEVQLQAVEWESLGVQYPTPGFCNELQHCFFAKGLSPCRDHERDEDEMMTIVQATVSEIERAIAQNLIQDAKSIAVFMKARAKRLV